MSGVFGLHSDICNIGVGRFLLQRMQPTRGVVCASAVYPTGTTLLGVFDSGCLPRHNSFASNPISSLQKVVQTSRTVTTFTLVCATNNYLMPAF